MCEVACSEFTERFVFGEFRPRRDPFVEQNKRVLLAGSRATAHHSFMREPPEDVQAAQFRARDLVRIELLVKLLTCQSMIVPQGALDNFACLLDELRINAEFTFEPRGI